MQKVRTALLEAGILVTMAIAVGLSANAVNHNGLNLTRNYFARPTAPPHRPPAPSIDPKTKPHDQSSGDSNRNPGLQQHVDQLPVTSYGFQAINTDLAAAWFNDPKTEQMHYVWVDARKADHYEDGHIPGAHLLDHYKADNYLEAVRPYLEAAEKIIVYCGGGDCQDSNLLATYLLDKAAMPHEKLYVYEEGIEGWQARALPLTTGPQP